MFPNSPDLFHPIRMYNSSLKASNLNLQSMEFKCHSITVCDYQMEILHHLLNSETKTLPSLALIEQQPEIKLGMRPLLLDFLMEVITILNLSKSTFPLTVNLIDRYCSTRIVKKQHYQLLGLTSLWISCKNLDSKFKIPTLNDLRKICVDSYFKDLFIEMEKHILKSLEWNVNSPTFDAFIDVFLNIIIHNNSNSNVSTLIKRSHHKIKLLATYCGELFQFYPNIYFDYTSSQIALISILVSILMLKLPINLISLLGYYNDILKSQEYRLNITADEGEEFDEILSVASFQSLFSKSFFKNLVKIIDHPPKSLEIKYFSESGKYTQLMRSVVHCAIDSLNTLLEPPVTPRIGSIACMSLTANGVNSVGTSIPLVGAKTGSTVLPLTPISNSTSPKRFSSDEIFSDSEKKNESSDDMNIDPNTPASSRGSPNNVKGTSTVIDAATVAADVAPSNGIREMNPPFLPPKKRSFDAVVENKVNKIQEVDSGNHLKRTKSVNKPLFFIP
ncbi:hypothetical protein DFJ63DRAFT_312274 [Scheffersomyces coipomensis]|uniref:uncharacterized protein n=1 Tax=Scheffersomyces coipomensis TaxID=1788519 RepID=UPI00315CD326